MSFKNLKSSEIKELRNKILKEQGFICPLCGKTITENDKITLDHQHKIRKTDENGVNGNGLIRGVLCLECNALEGKIFNSSTRFLHQPSKEQRIHFLENLIKYYQKPLYEYVHPSEVKKKPDVSKKNFNKLSKLYTKDTGKVLEYPKSKKLTKKLEILFEKYHISPYNEEISC